MRAGASLPTPQLAETTWQPNTPFVFWSLVALHVAIALFLKFTVDIDIEFHPQIGSWDWFWQAIPTANLVEHPWRSIWYFHAQPPLFNLLGALLMRLFYPNHLQALQFVYIVMGALTVGMSYVITLSFSRSAKLSLLVALFWAFNPSLFLYEAYILYDVLTAFEVTTLIFLIALYSLSSSKWCSGYLVATLIMLTALVMTRSLYHLILFVPTVIMLCVLAGKQWKWILVIGLCCFLIPLGWYAKNAIQVGQFGGSTWLGIGLWKAASASYYPEELTALAEQGVIDPIVAQLDAFSRPASYITYGYNQATDNPEWARNDFNNVNIPAISKLYLENSLRLIRYDPTQYLRAVLRAFFSFTNPASRFDHLEINQKKLGLYEVLYAELLQGHYPYHLFGRPGGMLLIILLPFTLILYGVMVVRRCGFAPRRWASAIQLDAPMLFTVMLIIYTLIVGCMLEFGENWRFKFAIEAPMWAFIATVLYRRYRRPPLFPLITSDK